MKNLLTARVLHLETRKKLIGCCILSTLLYASETWAISQIMWDKIEAFEMWMWRRCLKISYTEHKTNVEVLETVGEKRMLKKEKTPVFWSSNTEGWSTQEAARREG